MNLKLEYEKDFHQWIERHIQMLRESRFDELDVDHLIDELEGMAERDRRELTNRFIPLLAHLLKWQYQYKYLQDRWGTFTGGSWQGTITEQRTRITDLLADIPSLKRNLKDIVAHAYPKAVKIAIRETKLPQSTFPSECPYTLEQLLDDDFYPESK
jgi:hypothetical protein